MSADIVALHVSAHHTPLLMHAKAAIDQYLLPTGWWRGTVVERRSLAGELSLSCAQPAADG